MWGIKSKLSLASGILLFFVFLFTAGPEFLGWVLPDESRIKLYRFILLDRSLYVIVQSATFLIGASAVVLIAHGASGNSTRSIFSNLLPRLRKHWPAFLWVLQLGSSINAILIAVVAVPLFPIQPIPLWYAVPVVAIYVSGRLLFGTRPWRSDTWIGYLAAILFMFSAAWVLIHIAWFTFLLGAGGFGILLMSSVVSFTLPVIAIWSSLVLARNTAHRYFGGHSSSVAMVWIGVSGIILGAALHRPNAIQYYFFDVSLAPSLVLVSMILLCLTCATASVLDLLATFGKLTEKTIDRHTESLRPIVRTPIKRKRFWIDFGISVVASVVLGGIGFLIADLIHLKSKSVALLMLFGGPIVIFMIGVLRNRPGLVTGPGMLVLVLIGIGIAIPR